MSNVVINFVGNADELKPVENVLDNIVQKGDEVGDTWKKTSEEIAAQNKGTVETTNKLAKSIQSLSDATKTMDKSVIGGAYKEYLKQIQAQLGLTNKELISYAQNARYAAREKILTDPNATDQEIEEITIGIEVLNEQLEELQKLEEGTGEKTLSLRARLRAAKEELVAMAEAGLAGTPAFVELQEHAGELDDQMRDLNDQVRGIGSDTKNIDGLIDIAGGVAGGFAAAQGAAALFGDESEDVQKALLKLNAAMSILQGLQQIQLVLQKESAASILLTSIFYRQSTAAVVENTTAEQANVVVEGEQVVASAAVAEAEAAQAVATDVATESQIALNTAMELNPVAIIIAGVVALAAAVYIFSRNNKEAEETQEKLNDALKEATVFLDADLKMLTQRTAKQVALAKQRGASELEVAKIEGESGLTRLKIIDDARVAAAKAYNEAKSDDEESIKLKGKLYDKLIELEQQYHDEEKALQVDAINFKTQKNAEELKSFIALQEAKVAATITGSDHERVVQIQAIRDIAKEREKSADFIALTDGEKALARAEDDRKIRDLELANYQHYLKGRTAVYESYVANAKLQILKNQTDSVASITAVTDYEIAALKKRRDEAIKSDPNLNSGETKKIVAETNLAIAELEKEKELKLLEIQKAGINARLILVEKGSKDEYNLKLEQINNLQAIDLAAAELSQAQVTEINAKYLKERLELLKSFNESQSQDQISLANAALDVFGLSEKAKLTIVIQRLADQRALEISQANQNAAKIAEINAKYDKLILESKKETIRAILADNVKTFETFNAISQASNERILSQDKSTFEQKKAASLQILDAQMTSINLQKGALSQQLSDQLITQHEYDLAVQDLDNKKAAAIIANEDRITAAVVREIEKRTGFIKAAFSVFQTSLSATLDTSALTVALTQFQNLGAQVYEIGEKIKAGVITSAQGIKDIAVAAVQATEAVINQIFADSATRRQQELADTIAALENQKQVELNNKNLTEQQKADIEDKYKQREAQEKLRAFNADKEAKKAQAEINGFLAVGLAFATNPFPYSLIVAGIVAASTFAQVQKINNEKPPRFRHGEVDIQGPGTTTSDSISALISKGESVINADATAKWKDALVAINSDTFEPYLLKLFSDLAQPVGPELPYFPTAVQIDYNELGAAVAAHLANVIPDPKSVHVNIDESGINTLVMQGNNRTTYKSSRYSMS